MPCPLCRENFQIPRNGLDGLRVSFILKDLLDAKNVSNEASGGELCKICSTEAAKFYCVDCGQKLCDRCRLPHKKMRGGPHDVRPLSAELLWLPGSYCDEHPDKRLKLYCFDCKVNICRKCSADPHHQHKCGEIHKVAKHFAASMKSDIEPLLLVISKCRKKVTHIETQNKTFLTAVKKAKTEVQQRGDELKGRVDGHVSELLQELEQVESKVETEAKTLVESYNLDATSMESLQFYSSKLISKGSPPDITREADGLRVTANKLLQTHNSRGEYQTPDVTFEPSDFDFDKVTRSSGNIIGSVKQSVKSRNGICDVLWRAHQWLSSETRREVEQQSRHITHFHIILAMFFLFGVNMAQTDSAKQYSATFTVLSVYIVFELLFKSFGCLIYYGAVLHAAFTLWWLDLGNFAVLLSVVFWDYLFRLRWGLSQWVWAIAIKLFLLNYLVYINHIVPEDDIKIKHSVESPYNNNYCYSYSYSIVFGRILGAYIVTSVLFWLLYDLYFIVTGVFRIFRGPRGLERVNLEKFLFVG